MTSSKSRPARLCVLSAVLTATAGAALAQVVQPQIAQPPIAQPQSIQQQSPQPPAANPPPVAAVPAPTPASSSANASPPAAATSSPSGSPPPAKRGFFNDFGKWWDESIANFNAKIKEQQSKIDESNKKSSEAMKEAATATQQAMKNAADAMAHLGTSKMIEVHEVCAVAGNGAPDCQTAATNACRGKGFGGGQPLDIRTAEKCTASLWVSSQPPAAGDCPVETVVLRAACQ